MPDPVAASSLAWGTILIGVFGGLALFLMGMDQLTTALKKLAFGRMRELLGKLTTNRFTGVFTGATVTAVIQSSSVTTVLVVGFISAGLLSLTQSIGIILGANIGTTITAQVVAFKVSKYGLLMIAAGFGMHVLGRRDSVRNWGGMILGLGMIFFGMQLMSDATRPLRDYEPFIELMRQMSNPIAGILVGALFTAIVQSSSATTGIIIVLAGQGFVTLEAGIALALGANIGTCVTAILATLGKPRVALQAALVHVIFNVAGVLLWVAFIPWFADLVRTISPASNELEGLARVAADSPRQIANAHTVFNVANTLIFIWFAGPLAWLVTKLAPEKPDPTKEAARPKYINDLLVQTPDMALQQTRREIGRLAEMASDMVEQSYQVIIDGSLHELNELRRKDDTIDELHKRILAFLGKVSDMPIDQKQRLEVHRLITLASYVESIGDTIETHLAPIGEDRINYQVKVSEEARGILAPLHKRVSELTTLAVRAIQGEDDECCRDVIDAKASVNRLAHEAHESLKARLPGRDEARLRLYRLEEEMIEEYKRIYYFAKRIAKRLRNEG